MSAAAVLARGIVVEEFIERRANTLRGFAKVALPSGMILHDVAIHIAGTSAWAAPPSKAMIGRDGNVLRDAASGKIKYSPVLTFASKEVRDRFSLSVIEALRISHPDALAVAS